MLCNPYALVSLLILTVVGLRQDVKAIIISRSPTHEAERWAGVNLAGLEFGMQTTGALNQAPMVPPPITQIEHFRSQNVNAFRIPICWQRMQVSPIPAEIQKCKKLLFKKHLINL